MSGDKVESSRKKSWIANLLGGNIGKLGLNSKTGRNFIWNKLDEKLYNEFYKNKNDAVTHKEFSDKTNYMRYLTVRALAGSIFRGLDNNTISVDVAHKAFSNLAVNAMKGDSERTEAVQAYTDKYGEGPPAFFTLSPTQACNLNCTGCYAASQPGKKAQLDWDIVENIFRDCHDNLGMRFFVISGGEPFMYKSQGKGILDICEKYNDSYFLVYTNGTLLQGDKGREIVKRMRELGNITPAISLEGNEEQTDERRGKGIYKKVMNAMKNLREEGVPFGVSVTATSKNVNTLLDDEFYDNLFRNEGISYMWMFQYMPIGRNPDDGLEISNEQRLNLFREWEKMLKDEKRNYPFFDFWNSGMSSSGCIAGAREGGYFYINWDGNIMPCVFVPFYKDNVKELYKEGSSLKDAVQSPFFKDIRKWQSDYFHGKCVGCGGGTGNMLTPCLIRDNHDKFLEVVKKYYNEGEVKPENEEARKALESDKWNNHLTQKGNEYKELSSDIWREEYEQK